MCIQLDFPSLLCFQSMLIPGYPNHDHCKYSTDFLWMREPLSRPFSQVLSLILNMLFKLKPSASSKPSLLPPSLSRLNLMITQVKWFSLILSTPLLPHSDSILSFVVQFPKSCLTLCNPMTAALQAPPSSTVSWNLLKFMSIELVMLLNHLILCHPLLHLPSIFPSTRVFSNESALHIKWPKYWSFSISPSNKYPGLISFRIDWFDLHVVKETLKSLL